MGLLYPNTDFTFNHIRKVNVARCAKIEGCSPSPWTLGDWGNALGGECGELLNVLKKIRRIECGIRSKSKKTRKELVAEAREEIGDTFLYLDLVAAQLGIHLLPAIVDKFNADSDKYNMPEFKL